MKSILKNCALFNKLIDFCTQILKFGVAANQKMENYGDVKKIYPV